MREYLVDTNRAYAQVIEEADNVSGLTRLYLHGDNLISQSRISGNDVTTAQSDTYLYDGLGSVRTLSSSTGAITDTYIYEAFGGLATHTGTTENRYLFTGEQFDPNVGFYYLRARYYNPSIGRFQTMDTYAGRMHEPQTLHKYLYVHANPVNMVDPSGLVAFFFTGNISISSAGSSVLRAGSTRQAKKSLNKLLFGRPPDDLGIVGNTVIDYILKSVQSISGVSFNSKALAGTAAHNDLKRRIGSFSPVAGVLLEAEVFFDKDGDRTGEGPSGFDRRDKGSLGIDILVSYLGKRVAGIDLKLGRGFSTRKRRKIAGRLSNDGSVPVIEIFIGVESR